MNDKIILALDISTNCIGVSILRDCGTNTPEILKLNHISPKIPKEIKGAEALFMKCEIFEKEFLTLLQDIKIDTVVIEEPLILSNNVYTVATLLRFNGMLSLSIYKTLGIVPEYISSYDARKYAFPELTSIRKYNRKGECLPEKTIKKAVKDNALVPFGEYPFDVEKKQVLLDLISERYGNIIKWIINKKGNLAKENYDMSDSIVCGLGYMNLKRHGEQSFGITSVDIQNNKIIYTVHACGLEYNHSISLE